MCEAGIVLLFFVYLCLFAQKIEKNLLMRNRSLTGR